MNDKFSVIIPTIWLSDKIHNLLSDLNQSENVGEIILIDNTGEFNLKITTHIPKLRVISKGKNIYVNPAWNWGVSEAKFENLCISNDDVNFDTSVFDFIKNHIDKGVIGQWTGNYYMGNSSKNFNLEKIQDRPSGWGCLFFLKKKNWVDVPNNLKIACGDDFLINTIYGGAWQLVGLPIDTHMSISSNSLSGASSSRSEFLKIQSEDIEAYSKEARPLVSVLTLTYKRKNLLEEAIFSFLNQNYAGPSEMVIVNDCADVKYTFEHKKIKIINLDRRFDSISDKLKYGFSQCGANNIYRLDDDDLLCPWALTCVAQQINERKGMEVYRSEHQYFFTNNNFSHKTGNINNGNVYSKKYIMETEFPKKSGNEDVDFTFNFAKKIDIKKNQATMIYRWGMNTYHISTMGFENESTLKITDDRTKNSEQGTVTLSPQFYNDYYSQIPLEDREKYQVL